MEREENELILQKKAKLDAITKSGVYAYGGKFDVTSTVKELTDNFTEGKVVSLAGRLMACREHGKAKFYDLKDSTGKIQLYVKADIVGEKAFEQLRKGKWAELFERID